MKSLIIDRNESPAKTLFKDEQMYMILHNVHFYYFPSFRIANCL